MRSGEGVDRGVAQIGAIAVGEVGGPEADEGTLFVHAVDVIGGHCGSNPSPTWNDVTVLWSTGARWTLQPYLQAGYPVVP